MAKRLSENDKGEIIKNFTRGKTIDQLSEEFNCTKLTISRNLKKNLGQKEYKDLIKKNKPPKKLLINNDNNEFSGTDNNSNEYIENSNISNHFPDIEEPFPLTSFVEITPLDQEIDNVTQKDISSVPLSDINLPKIVYMIIDNKIELNIKFLKDYPEWHFLPQDDLNRKTIEIYFDLKIAKRFCNKEQKVIKVPNPEVFRIVTPILLSKGISRIVTSDKLIAL